MKQTQEKARLEVLYKEKIRPALLKELNLNNVMDVPKISKIVLNVGVKEAVADSKILQVVQKHVTSVTGSGVYSCTYFTSL